MLDTKSILEEVSLFMVNGNYTGPLVIKAPMIVKKARTSFNAQKQRCTNHKCYDYPRYGGKNIEIKYSSTQYINWYIEEFNKRLTWQNWPVCSRNLDLGNYEFGNVQLKERSENGKEATDHQINKTFKKKPVRAINLQNGITKDFSSIKEAAIHFSASRKTLSNVINHPTIDTYVGYKWEVINETSS